MRIIITPLLLLSFCRASPPPCGVGRLIARCVNRTHYETRDAPTAQLCASAAPCRFGFLCVAGNSCRAADIASHLARAADYQIVESVPVAQLASCTEDHLADVASGLMLCDVVHSTRAVRPTFGHILGNTWVQFGNGPNARAPACAASPAAWRGCFGANIKAMVDALQGEAPELLFSGGLMEFLPQANADAPGGWPTGYCVPGSLGQWGPNTCVPDVRLPLAQQYYVDWGKTYIDAGIRALFFGQADLTGGRGSGDGISPEGAAGFASVVAQLRAYAAGRGLGAVWFGPQAASGILLSNGTQVADWVYGAQHLQPQRNGSFLTQPLLKNGSFVWAQYGPGDLHDASRHNAGGGAAPTNNSLPTVLDYDNFSGGAAVYDDIRRLASWPNASRGALVAGHYRWLRAYSGGAAVVSIPISKWLACPNGECQCQGNSNINIWGSGTTYFSAFACGLLPTMAELWADPSASPFNRSATAAALGQQLVGADDSVVALVAAVLGRNVSSYGEYAGLLGGLPPRLPAARGPRAALVAALMAREEFTSGVCPSTDAKWAQCTVERATLALLLRDCADEELIKALANGTLTVPQVVDRVADAADAAGLYAQ
jgi:hypothetical protein